jgi:hypothetical protein
VLCVWVSCPPNGDSSPVPWKLDRTRHTQRCFLWLGEDSTNFRTSCTHVKSNYYKISQLLASLFYLSPDLQSFVALVVDQCHSQPPWRFCTYGNQVKIMSGYHILKAHYANQRQKRQCGRNSVDQLHWARTCNSGKQHGWMHMSRVFSMGDRPIKAKTYPDPAGHTAHLA